MTARGTPTRAHRSENKSSVDAENKTGTKTRNPTTDAQIRHASCVAVNGRGVLITGASGQGKSGLALSLLAYGADLISDDRTIIWRDGTDILATAPEGLSGMIEARQVGILRVPRVDLCTLSLIVDLDTPETDRLPERRVEVIEGIPVPVQRNSQLPHFNAAIMTYLRGQREA